MRELRFYKLSLVLPLIISGALVPLVFANARFPEWLGPVILFTAYSGLIGGIPYGVLAGLLLWWARGRNEEQFRLALILSPILMLPIFSLFIVIVALVVDRQSVGWQTIDGLFFYVPWILGYGYGYVVLVLAATVIFRRLGVISPSHAI